MEATGVYWRPIWAVLQGHFELLLVNPHHIKVIPGRKTDTKDCEWIADLLQHGLVRGSFVPPTDIQDLRDLTRYRAELKQAQCTVANRIQKLLEQANIKLSSVASNALGVSGRRMIEAIIAGEDNPEHLAALAKKRLKEKIPELRLALQGYVRDHHRFLLREFLDEWNTLAERISRVEQEIDRRIAPYEHAVTLWQSIPGMDRVTACNLVAELGVNMAQFPSAQHLTAWAGLCPGNNESAGKRMSGTTRPGNKWLRRTLCQSAWAVTRKKDCYLSAQFRRLAARRGVKRAVMAVAHSMLIIAYTMLKDRQHLPRSRWKLPGANQQGSSPELLREAPSTTWTKRHRRAGDLDNFRRRKTVNPAVKYGTAIVLAHLLVNIVHGAAHRELHVELRPAAMLFVIGVILLCPLIAMVLLWVSQEPLGLALLALSMAASLIFGLYKHFAVMGAGTQ